MDVMFRCPHTFGNVVYVEIIYAYSRILKALMQRHTLPSLPMLRVAHCIWSFSF
uniref:Uncharacterized protein n=1 Tax=Anguilla anguilla TaxID=7936 RepID=A0A0E9RNA0_ANGAN